MGSAQITRFDVAVGGGELAAFGLGRPDPGRPRVLVVHGITANSRAWLPLQRALGDRATLIAPDLRGRGASSALPGPCGIGAHAADVLAVLDRLELEQAVLAGHSMGAYVISHMAVEHPHRVRSLVLVDGGLAIPGTEGVDPQEFANAFLGPALARLQMRFASREDYRNWWRAHPAFAGGGVEDRDLVAYADYDLVGVPPQLRSSVSEPAVREDAAELAELGTAAHRLQVPATLLCAPRGLLDDPNPMQPLAAAEAWAAEAPELRAATLVAGVNHYSITLGKTGAGAVAEAIAAALGR